MGSLSVVFSPSGAFYDFTAPEIDAGNYAHNFSTSTMIGTQTITVTAVDSSGTRSTDELVTIPTDGIGPEVAITSHAHLDYYPVDSDVPVSGTVRNFPGSPSSGWVDSVEYKVEPLMFDYQNASYTPESGTYNFTFDTTDLVGNLTITVRGKDKNGDPGIKGIILVQDSTDPEVDELNPTSGTFGIFSDTGVPVNIQVVFSEAVRVVSGTPTPQLTLQLDSGPKTVDYSSGSGTTTLLFPYNVAVGDKVNPLAYANPNSSLTGSIEDLQGRSADLTLPGWSNTIEIDGVRPSISTLVTADVDGNGFIDRLIVTFDEDVDGSPAGIDGSKFSVSEKLNVQDNGDTSDAVIWVNLNDDVLATDEKPKLTINRGGIKDLAGTENAQINNFSSTDGAVPAVLYVSSGDDDTDPFGIFSDTGVPVSIQVKFSESVTVTGTPQLTLQLDSGTTTAGYSSGSGSDTLVFSYEIAEGENSSDLDYAGTGALSGTIKDQSASIDWTDSLPGPGSGNTLAERKNIKVDGDRPVISTVALKDNSAPTGSWDRLVRRRKSSVLRIGN